MKKGSDICSEMRKKYNDNFKTGHVLFRSFHDLLWQIAVNDMLKNEKEPILFYLDIYGDFGNELILAYSSGRYKKTGVYFISDNYNECSDIVEQLNIDFFEINKNEQMMLINKSMQNG